MEHPRRAVDKELLYVGYSGIHACLRYLHLFRGPTRPRASTALAETLFWWRALDERTPPVPGYEQAMADEGLLDARPGLLLASHMAAHRALAVEAWPKGDTGDEVETPGRAVRLIWQAIDDAAVPSGEGRHELPSDAAPTRSYRAHLAGRDTTQTVYALWRLFHTAAGINISPLTYDDWLRERSH